MNRDDADANGAARQRSGQSTPRPKRKKGRLPATPGGPTSVPEPFLALAPAPLTTVPAQPESGLILPSDYVRSVNPSEPRYASGLMAPPTIMPGGSIGDRSTTPRPLPTPTPPTTRGYITNLISPPFIVPGGRPASPLSLPPRPPMQQAHSARSVHRSRDSQRSPMPLTVDANRDPLPSTPRRRGGRSRVVNSTISSRPSVASREEHLTRRASMRRTNVWDDLDLPDAPEPPPPFPFPTTSNARLPPTFSPVDVSVPPTPGLESTSAQAPMGNAPGDRPRSPPPTFDEAIRVPTPPSVAETMEEEEDGDLSDIDTPDKVETAEQQEDRRLWNEDIRAGYSLQERVIREAQRRHDRAVATGSSSSSGDHLVPRSEVEAAIRGVNGGRETISKDRMEVAVRTAMEVLGSRYATKEEIVAAARNALALKGSLATGEPMNPTAPAEFLDVDSGPQMLRRQEEPGILYRVVHDSPSTRARAPSQPESFQRPLFHPQSPDPDTPHSSGGDLLGVHSPRPRSQSTAAAVPPVRNQRYYGVSSSRPRDAVSTVDDLASIYDLPPRPSSRQNNITPRPASPASRLPSSSMSSPPPTQTTSARTDTPSYFDSPEKRDSGIRDPPLLAAYKRLASPAPYRSPSPLPRQGSPAVSNRSTSPQVSMANNASQPSISLKPEELRTKKEILEALEKEDVRKVLEVPKPVTMNAEVVMRSEEPGIKYRLVAKKNYSSVNQAHQIPDSSMSQFPPPFTPPAHGHSRSSSASQVQSTSAGPSMRTHRPSSKPATTDSLPSKPSHGHGRGASFSGFPTDPLQPPAPPLLEMIDDGKASPTPAPAPPLPPRPPQEYISEYKGATHSGTPLSGPSAVPSGVGSASSHSHASGGSPVSDPSQPTPWSSPKSNPARQPNHPSTPPTSSPPVTRRPALPSIPSTGSSRSGPLTSTSGKGSPMPHSTPQLERTQVPPQPPTQPSVYGSVPLTTSPSNSLGGRPLPQRSGLGSTSTSYASTQGSAYSSLGFAPGHPGLTPSAPAALPEPPLQQKRQSLDNAPDRHSSASPGPTELRDRQGSLTRLDGKASPTQGIERQTPWYRRLSTDKDTNKPPRPTSTSSSGSSAAKHEMGPFFSEGWSGPKQGQPVRSSTLPVGERGSSMANAMPQRHSVSHGMMATLSESPKTGLPRPLTPSKPADEWGSSQNESALFLSSTSPGRGTCGLPPGAQPSAFAPASFSLREQSMKAMSTVPEDADHPRKPVPADSFGFLESSESSRLLPLPPATAGPTGGLKATGTKVDRVPTPNLIALDTPELEREATLADIPAEDQNGKETKTARRSQDMTTQENGTGSEVSPTTPVLPPLFSQPYEPASPTRGKENEETTTAVRDSLLDDMPNFHEPIRLDEHGNVINQAREAAMKRRDLTAPGMDMNFTQSSPRSSISISQGKRPAPPPPHRLSVPKRTSQLIALANNQNPSSPSAVSPDIVSLAASTSALLNLLEAADPRPMAESSAQGAAKAAVREQFRFELAQQRDIEGQIRETLERSGNRNDTNDKPLPNVQGDNLPGYTGGNYDGRPQKYNLEEEADLGMLREGPQRHDPNSPLFIVTGMTETRSLDHHSRTGDSPSQSQASAGSMNFSNDSYRSEPGLSSSSSLDFRRRAPVPPSKSRPPPPPPPPKSYALSRPPPPPPPSRPPPSSRGPLPNAGQYNVDLNQNEPFPDFVIPDRWQESPAPELNSALSAPSPASRFISPLDPHPPEPYASQQAPRRSESPAQMAMFGRGTSVGGHEQGAPLWSEVQNSGAQASRDGRSTPTNHALWHNPPVYSASPRAAPTVAALRRPPPPIPNRNSGEFLSSAAAQVAKIEPRPRPRNVASYSSSTSSLLDFEAALVPESLDPELARVGSTGSVSQPFLTSRRGSREPALIAAPPRRSSRLGSTSAPSTVPPGYTPNATNAPANGNSARNSAQSLDSPTSTNSHPGSSTASTAHALVASVAPSSPEITDVDLFVSNIEGSGYEYEGLSHLAAFLGPAKETGASELALSTLLPAEVEVESRRINAKGKVKLKLSVLGVRVANCPTCLAQFRGGDAAVLFPRCGHVSHETCARRWFREKNNCMVCRTELEMAV